MLPTQSFARSHTSSDDEGLIDPQYCFIITSSKVISSTSALQSLDSISRNVLSANAMQVLSLAHLSLSAAAARSINLDITLNDCLNKAYHVVGTRSNVHDQRQHPQLPAHHTVLLSWPKKQCVHSRCAALQLRITSHSPVGTRSDRWSSRSAIYTGGSTHRHLVGTSSTADDLRSQRFTPSARLTVSPWRHKQHSRCA